MPQTTYLELSDPLAGTHKFYEVTVDGLTVTTRYGRIGTDGQTRTATFASPDDARAKAKAVVATKGKKGYAPATPGAREKQSTSPPVPDVPVPKGSLFPYSVRFQIRDPAAENPLGSDISLYEVRAVGTSLITEYGPLYGRWLRETTALASPEEALRAVKEKAAAKQIEVEQSGLSATVEESAYFERIDPATRRAHYYRVIVDEAKLTRLSGFFDAFEMDIVEEPVDSPEAARAAADRILRDRIAEGYRPSVHPWKRDGIDDPSGGAEARTYPEEPPRGTRYAGAIGFEDLTVGAADAPTSDGRTLRFDPEAGYEARIEWSLTRLPGAGDLPVDGVERRLWVPDADGRVWTAAERSTAWVFYEALARAQIENDLDIGLFDDANASIREAFDAPLLAGVTLCGDDRAYRSLWIGGERVQVIFKYSQLVFDLARVAPTESSLYPAYYVRLRQGSSFDRSVPLTEVRSTEQLPELVFGVIAPPLDAAGAVCNAVTGSWEMAPFPPPLVFEPTDERGEPNEAVYLLPNPSAGA